ncbi:hypothetical protein B4113_3581 [Geobacillus sp. B4113_201601]|nr:hypothetical protein B4113_3581 [Geobacillus sp. B4113_201601]
MFRDEAEQGRASESRRISPEARNYIFRFPFLFYAFLQ